jgi:hypothetical protein
MGKIKKWPKTIAEDGEKNVKLEEESLSENLGEKRLPADQDQIGSTTSTNYCQKPSKRLKLQ